MFRISFFPLFVVFGASLAMLYAWQVPVKNLRLTSLFGESRYDHFHNGIDFANEQPIYPIEDGELLFYSEEDPLTPFMGIGNHMVVEHQDKVRSYYYHLAEGSIDKKIASVNKIQSLATMGNSGKSFGSHLHLTIVDSKNRRMMNPGLLLPLEEDRIKPMVGTLFFTVKNKPNIFKIRNGTIINYKNSIKLYLIAGDVKPFYQSTRNLSLANARGLRRLSFWIDGNLYNNYDFDYLFEKDGKLVLSNGYDYSMTYGLPFNFLLGDFTPSESVHEFYIEVEDQGGNQDGVRYRVIFRL